MDKTNRSFNEHWRSHPRKKVFLSHAKKFAINFSHQITAMIEPDRWKLGKKHTGKNSSRNTTTRTTATPTSGTEDNCHPTITTWENS